MKELYSLKPEKRKRLIFILTAFFVLLLITEFIEKRSLKSIDQDFSSLYQDRLLPASQMYELAELLHKKRMLFENIKDDAEFIAELNLKEIKAYNGQIDEVLKDYGKTYLVDREELYFKEFKSVEIAKPGFLNIYFHVSFWKKYLTKVIKLNLKYGSNKSPKKSRVMKSSSRMDVHDVTVNSHKLSPSKERTSKVRLQINKLRKTVLSNAPVGEIIKLYKSTFGQLVTLKSQGSPKYPKMIKELNEIVKLIEPKQAKKYARGYRKVKTKQQLKSFAQKVSILKKVSPVVAGVVNAESKEAKRRVNNTV